MHPVSELLYLGVHLLILCIILKGSFAISFYTVCNRVLVISHTSNTECLVHRSMLAKKCSNKGLVVPTMASNKGLSVPTMASNKGLVVPTMASNKGLSVPTMASNKGLVVPTMASNKGLVVPTMASTKA